MMKSRLSISLFFCLSCSDNKSSSTKIVKADNITAPINDTFSNDCSIPSINNFIVSNDTIIDYNKNNGHLIKSFDSKSRLRKVFISNLYENNADKIFSSTVIYDTIGQLILENKTDKLITWHCYKYKYDSKRHLIFKSGFSSGEMGFKVSYIYENDKLIKEITERGGQKAEKDY